MPRTRMARLRLVQPLCCWDPSEEGADSLYQRTAPGPDGLRFAADPLFRGAARP